MARIRTQRGPDRTRVTLVGRLTADDMVRLARACADALTSRLEIAPRQVTHTDGTARAVLDQLASGRVVIRSVRNGAPGA